MGVGPGYQQTELGVLPDEWDIAPLGHGVAELTAGVSVNSVNDEHRLAGDQPAVLKTSSIAGGQFLPEESKLIAPRDIRRVRLSPRADTVIISRMNTPDRVGECGYVPVDYPNLFLPDRLWMTSAPQGSDMCAQWLSYLLSSREYKTRIKGLATGTSGTMKNIAKGALLAMLVAYPPPAEQRAIAAALCDVDSLLDGLNRLIAKKRDLKHAAMQQLLTGQTRLPGFQGAWELKTLGDLGSTYGGLAGKTKADFGNGAGRYITFMNVMTNVVVDRGSFERVNVAPTESQNRVMGGDLLFNTSSETPEEVAMCAVLLGDVPDLFLNSFCFGFRFNDGADADRLFLVYYLRSGEGRELMKSLAQGSTRYNISKLALLTAQLRLPSPREQVAIAEVLSDMDAELAALEARRYKTRDLKQAIMQELLSGKTRLIPVGGTSA